MKRTLLIVCVIIALSGLSWMYANRNAPALGRQVNRGGENVIYQLDGALQREFHVYGDLLLISTNQSLTAINKQGDVKWETQFTSKNPLLSVNGNYILMADRGGKRFMVVNDGKILTQSEATGDIFTAKINANGFVALACTESGFKSQIIIYDAFGTEKYSWKISDNYVLDCEVSPNNRFLAAVLLTTDEEKVLGSVAFVDIQDKKMLERPSFVNCIFSSVAFANNNGFIAVSDTAAILFSNTGKQVWNKNFDGRTLHAFSFNPQGRCHFFFENSRNTSTLEAYSLDGKLRNSLELEFEVRGVSMNRQMVVANGARDLVVLDSNGKKKVSLTLNSDMRWQGLLADKKNVMVVHGNSIDLVRP